MKSKFEVNGFLKLCFFVVALFNLASCGNSSGGGGEKQYSIDFSRVFEDDQLLEQLNSNIQLQNANSDFHSVAKGVWKPSGPVENLSYGSMNVLDSKTLSFIAAGEIDGKQYRFEFNTPYLVENNVIKVVLCDSMYEATESVLYCGSAHVESSEIIELSPTKLVLRSLHDNEVETYVR